MGVFTDNFDTSAQINFLIEGIEFAGELILSAIVFVTPRMTYWESDSGCTLHGMTDCSGTIELAAHNPSLPGWTDQRVYCEVRVGVVLKETGWWFQAGKFTQFPNTIEIIFD
jgi:hypothetical protein